MSDYVNAHALSSPQRLAERLEAPRVRVVDARFDVRPAAARRVLSRRMDVADREAMRAFDGPFATTVTVT